MRIGEEGADEKRVRSFFADSDTGCVFSSMKATAKSFAISQKVEQEKKKKL